ncbi:MULTISPECIES: DUF742 domain-containing protein [unclassified Streptomyces]|uniref:DUF742 domain-containing protein n=1 Tax=unclassified Streptomyces TaxID=2593676 RepID=UPI001163B753|nr:MULTISPECIES: DUF742 domain-containing protein [unclassified Streptomyces]NMI57138.1 DUF742 domain-containing protein [Streptomyces sp. RLA2-12]QDN56511.1 DUF742 domain-containing protein [Streptomyces sp. S1D4-20]QDN66688.1 DUF742 domain-containing protein [Streptomyces sp. S1D4-14]QDO49095.1 DUF742 domain-containing protein [Streptomyces sp. RLB3-5]QDO59336.1 DUF742 domain-containing protein [Streptomyces sp. RLB1-8]
MTPPQRRRRYPKEEFTEPPRERPPQEGEEDGEEEDPKNPGRLYLLTGGGEAGERADLDLVTLIVARADAPTPTTQPEQSALFRLCQTPLSVAELSAYLNLPFSVVTVLLTELLAAELVQARAPIVRSALPDRSLLEAVMHGLQKL